MRLCMPMQLVEQSMSVIKGCQDTASKVVLNSVMCHMHR